jgi:hypothetical protein
LFAWTAWCQIRGRDWLVSSSPLLWQMLHRSIS